jgi:hypothetical protein
MSATSIILSTPTNPKLQWFDSFKDLTDKELNEIAIHCRSATAALFTELSDRRHPWKDQKLDNYQDMLLKNANQINEEGLTIKHELYLNQLCTFLADPDDAQTERNEIKIVKQYLWLVSRVIGWSYVLLILYTLGKHKLQKLDEDRRIKLVKHIVQNRDSLSCPRLEEKATRCNLCQTRMTLPPLHCFVSKDLSQMSKLTFHLREAPESAREKWSLKQKINKTRLWEVSYRMRA